MEKQSPVSIVHNIFINFFGEENVDLQNTTIIVHFPRVTVTNEYNKSIDITHLWAKIVLSPIGTIEGTFQLIRSEFTRSQFDSGYSHSHIRPISRGTCTTWSTPCLGRGPIKGTILKLTQEFSEEFWNLFCLELSKYVTVESVTGTPYIRLESVMSYDRYTCPILNYLIPGPDNSRLFLISEYPPIIKRMIRGFTRYIIQKKPFGFNYNNNSYGISMSNRDILVTLSNLFIEYYNDLPDENKSSIETLFQDEVLLRCKSKDGRLFSRHSVPIRTREMGRISSVPILLFKGEPIYINIVDDNVLDLDANICTILSPSIATYVVDNLLMTVNSRYGQSTNQRHASTNEVYRYI